MKTKNILLCLTSLLLVSVYTIPTSFNELKGSFEKGAFDYMQSCPTNVVKGLQIGDDSTVSVSPTFAQTGTYNDGTTTYNVLRFATAIKGNIESISYLRGMVYGKADAPRTEVTTVYRAIKAGDDLYYYNGTDLTTDDSYEGQYYWACYTIKYTSDDYKFHAIPVTISVNNKEYTERTASFGILNGEEHTHDYSIKSTRKVFNVSGSTYYMSCACGEKGTETFTAYTLYLQGGATFNDGTLSRRYASNSLVGGIIVPEKEGYYHNGFVETNEVTTYSSVKGLTFSMASQNLYVQPHYQVNSFATNISQAGGKLELNHTGTKINRVNGFADANAIMISNGAIRFNDTYAESATIYQTKVAPKNGYWFNSMAPLVIRSQKVKITYQIQNQGGEKIAFNVHQINGSTVPQTPSNLLSDTIASRNVVLNVGEAITFTLETSSLSNDNVLTNYSFIGDSKVIARLAINQYFELQDDRAETSNITIKNLADSNFKVTFKDGSTSRSFKEGNSIQNTLVTAPEGYALAGWIDANDTSKFYRVGSYVISENDATLIPYFEANEYLDLGLKGNTPPIHSKVNGFSQASLRSQLTQTPVVVGEGDATHYEIATNFNYTNAVQQGWYFISMIPGTSVNGTSYKLTFVMSNLGLDTLNIEMWQTASSSTPKGTNNGHTSVTIEPNQTVTTTIEYSNISNNNMMTYYEFTSTLTHPLALQVIEYFAFA